jgi:sortase (surface protein transpeptidase)
MSRSIPVVVRIPAIGVRARIIPLGVYPDGEVAVPSLSTPFLTSWYDRGPTPGQPGAAVLLGHVDAAGVGPAVFYRLGDLRPGDLVYVTRRDRRTAVFRVTSVRMYPRNAFPAMRVYGPTRRPALRLVTCGGQFDWATHSYLDRTIVFADFAGRLLRPLHRSGAWPAS